MFFKSTPMRLTWSKKAYNSLNLIFAINTVKLNGTQTRKGSIAFPFFNILRTFPFFSRKIDRTKAVSTQIINICLIRDSNPLPLVNNIHNYKDTID